MTMTDPIADMLSRVRNASNAHHDTVSMPTSKLKANIADILKQEGYIADYTVEGHTLSLELKYNNRERSLSGLLIALECTNVRLHGGCGDQGVACQVIDDLDVHVT